MKEELRLRGLGVVSELKIAVIYKGVELDACYRIDLLVADLVIVEIKAIEQLSTIHEAQLLTYLRFSNKRLGLLLNFQASQIKYGIRRVVNNLQTGE